MKLQTWKQIPVEEYLEKDQIIIVAVYDNLLDPEKQYTWEKKPECFYIVDYETAPETGF